MAARFATARGLSTSRTASALALFAAAKAVAKPLGPFTSRCWSRKPNTRAATAIISTEAPLSADRFTSHSTATRASAGRASLTNWSRFSLVTSGCPIVSPVRLPPGCARLATPSTRGSVEAIMTMAMAEVACWAARVASGPAARMTAGFKRTTSAARPMNFSAASADRRSTARVCPSIQPRSPSCFMNATYSGVESARGPVRSIASRAGVGCASAASGARVRPNARTTASSISRMGTSVEDCWRGV